MVNKVMSSRQVEEGGCWHVHCEGGPGAAWKLSMQLGIMGSPDAHPTNDISIEIRPKFEVL